MQGSPSILVLGSFGMLGSAIREVFAQGGSWHVDGTQRHDRTALGYLDILEASPEEWAKTLRNHRYDYIINCIGILKSAVNVRDANSVRRAIRVNALFPHELAATAAASRILSISTDAVFSGQLGRPYVETDATDCVDTYGRTKVLGESPASNVINIRCSIIGRDSAGKGLVEWVLRSPDGAELIGFDDQHWNGVTTRQFAELCRRIVESASFDRIRAESSVHHFCPNSAITKYDLLCRIRDAAGRKIHLKRGQSGEPSARILGSVFTSLPAIYPESMAWDAVIRETLRV